MALAHQSKGEGQKRLTKCPAKPLADPEVTHAHPLQLAFDFVVAERAKYIPGSGPPLAPIGIMPEHDKDGIIEGLINIEGEVLYVVSYEHKPALRMSVRAENLRDYVSSRTLEDWEWKQTRIRNKLEEETVDPRLSSRDRKEGVKESKMSKSWTESRAYGPKKKIRRPPGSFGRRKKSRGTGPGKARTQSVASLGTGTGIGIGMLPRVNPHQSQSQESSYLSPKRTNTSNLLKQRGLAETVYSEPESEDVEDTSAALDRQLNGPPSADFQNHSKLSKQNSPSTISFLRPPTSARRIDPTHKRCRDISSISTGDEVLDFAESSIHNDKRRKTPNMYDSVASISSRVALEIYERLEHGDQQTKVKSIASRYNKPLPTRHTLTTIDPPSPPQLVRLTKAQTNKTKFDAKFGNISGVPEKAKHTVIVAVPSHVPELHSSPDNPFSHQYRRTSSMSCEKIPSLHLSERPSSRDEKFISGYRRSERSSSRTAVSYIIPPLLKPEDLEPEVESEPSDHGHGAEVILGEKWRTVKGKPVMFYLIRSQAGWENSWEPADNFGEESIREWEMQKKARRNLEG